MALKSRIAKLEDVVEALRAEYVKGDDGAYYLSVDDVDSLPAVRGLKSKRDELLAEKKALETKFAGVDIDDLKAAKTKLAEFEKGNAGGKNDEKIAALESRIAQLTQTAQQEKAQLEAKANGAIAEKDQYIRRSEIRGVLAKHNGNVKFLEHALEPMLRVIDGKVVVVDEAGNPKIKNSMNESMTLEDLVVGLKANPEYGGAFGANPQGGSGAQGSGGGSSGSAPGTVKPGSKEYFANLEKVAKGEMKIAE